MSIRHNGRIVEFGVVKRPGAVPDGQRKNINARNVDLSQVETLTQAESQALAYPWKYPIEEIMRIKEKQRVIIENVKEYVLSCGREG